jgi:hypothetical protein
LACNSARTFAIVLTTQTQNRNRVNIKVALEATAAELKGIPILSLFYPFPYERRTEGVRHVQTYE